MGETTLWFTLMFLASGLSGVVGLLIGYALTRTRGVVQTA